ncbi:MAG: hypothetical protein O7G84_15640, partial [Gammaproteobacteria bacterium]|nr:hypothetical protein [Gammaproteobacteria bacterium]
MPSANPESWGLIFAGAVLAFYAFIGFEDMVDVAEEVRRVQRTLPTATPDWFKNWEDIGPPLSPARSCQARFPIKRMHGVRGTTSPRNSCLPQYLWHHRSLYDDRPYGFVRS